MAFIDTAIAKLSKQLYPNGRAFAMPDELSFLAYLVTEQGIQFVTEDEVSNFIDENDLTSGGILKRLHRALDKGKVRLYNDARSTYDSILPLSDGFTADDATDWERRLGITTNNTDLATRKLAIQRKMNYPGTDAAMQSALYLQQQLQAAGFDLYIYENIFSDGMGGYITKTPAEVLGIDAGDAIYGNAEYGNIEYGQTYASSGITLIANHIEDAADADFTISPNYRSTFFIAGSTITTFADVPAERHDELRQLILMIKPVPTVGFMFVNYV